MRPSLGTVFLFAFACSSPGGEVTEPRPIVENGVVTGGWARTPLFQFNRAQVPPDVEDRLREWDFYAIQTPEFAIVTTIAEIHLTDGTMILASVTFHAFGSEPRSEFLLLPDEGLDLAPTPGGNVRVEGGNGFLEYRGGPSGRTIAFEFGVSRGRPEGTLVGEIELEIAGDSLSLVTPFAEPGHFFYENKFPGLPAKGFIRVDGANKPLPADSFAAMDWVRAVVPKTIDWTWAIGVGELAGKRIGLNLGSVFGDESRGTADAVIVDGHLHKLDRVVWDTTGEAWRFHSEDGRVDLTLEPNGTVERQHLDLFGLYSTDLVKPYGRWRGVVPLEDGCQLSLDGLNGAAETNHIEW